MYTKSLVELESHRYKATTNKRRVRIPKVDQKYIHDMASLKSTKGRAT